MKSIMLATIVFLLLWNSCKAVTVANCSKYTFDIFIFSDDCEECDTGYFLLNGTICESENLWNCMTSTNYIGCTSCPTGFGLQSQYNSTTATGCTTCQISECSVCSTNASLCSSCSSDYFLQDQTNTTCLSTASWNCISATNYLGCTSCSNQYGLSNNFNGTNLTACSTCNVSNCGNCSNDFSICQSCNSDYLLTSLANTSCISASSLNCNQIGNFSNYEGCTSCSENLGLQTNFNSTSLTECSSCAISGCTNCFNDYLLCQSCQTGFFLGLNGTCQNATQWNCITSADNIGCISCTIGYGLQSNYENSNLTGCGTCPVGCFSCGTNTICEECQTDYFLLDETNTTCVSQSLWNCTNSTNYLGCTSCQTPFGLQFNYNGTTATGCTTCQISECSVCSSNYSLCSACFSDYFFQDLTNTVCLSTASWNCISATNYLGCTSCSNQYGLSNNFNGTNLTACSTCNVSNCGNCSNDFSICQSCNSDYLLTSLANTSCISASSLNCNQIGNFSNYEGCTSCTIGYGLQTNYQNTNLTGCGTCLVGCSSCDINNTICEECQTDYFLLDETNTTCVPQSLWNCTNSTNYFGCTSCQAAFGLQSNYNNTTATGCATCQISNCSLCSINATQCSACSSDYFFQDQTNTTCLSIASWNCTSAANYQGCTSCLNQYGLSNDFNGSNLTGCLTCQVDDCLSCSSDSSLCSECSPNFFLFDQTNSSCINASNYGCNSSSNYVGCETCPSSSELFNKSNLSICYSSNASQFNCSDGAIISGEGCTACGDGTFITGGMVDGAFYDVCASCPSQCTQCDNSIECTSCSGNASLITYLNFTTLCSTNGKFFF